MNIKMRPLESKESTHLSTTSLKSSIIYLTAAILVAFLMRMLAYSLVTANGGITFRGFDDFYHMRLIFPIPLISTLISITLSVITSVGLHFLTF